MNDIPQLVLQYGMGGAVLVAMCLFLKYLGEERKDRAIERESTNKERARFLDVLEQYRQTVDTVDAKCPKN